MGRLVRKWSIFLFFSDPQLNTLDDHSSSSSGFNRKGSGSSNGSIPLSQHLSASNPDLSSNIMYSEETRNEYPEHVLKIFRSDQTYKYFLVNRVRF